MKIIIKLIICWVLLSSNLLAEKLKEKISILANVKGLVCDFCARGLEKKFAKVKEVEKIIVSLEKGTVTIFMKAGQNLEDKKIIQIIRNNGITTEKITRSVVKK